MSVANVYYKHIIGRQAETRRRLEDETKTRVDVPKIGFDGDIGTYSLLYYGELIFLIF